MPSTAPCLAERLRGKKTPLKAALLDQRVVAGLGNIYVCEALFRAGLSPRRQAHTVGPVRAARLAAAIREVLQAAIAAGGSSLRDYVGSSGELGYFQHNFSVYDREGQPCPALRLRRARPAHRPIGPLDLLLSRTGSDNARPVDLAGALAYTGRFLT